MSQLLVSAHPLFSWVVLCDREVLGLCFFSTCPTGMGAGWTVGAQLPRFMCYLPCLDGTRAESNFYDPWGCSWLMQDREVGGR